MVMSTEQEDQVGLVPDIVNVGPTDTEAEGPELRLLMFLQKKQ